MRFGLGFPWAALLSATSALAQPPAPSTPPDPAPVPFEVRRSGSPEAAAVAERRNEAPGGSAEGESSTPAAPPRPGVEEHPAVGPGWSWVTPAMPATEIGDESTGVAGPVTYREVLGRVPWSGTSLVFNNSVTTTVLGIGRDYVGTAHQAYVQQYVLVLNYYLLSSDDGISLRAQTAPSVEVELTNSDVTTDYREPIFGDLPVSLVARFPIVRSAASPLLSSTLLTNLTTIFATSKLSRGQILTLSPRVVWAQGLPLLGEGAKWLSNVGLIGAVRYDRLFTQATVPSDPSLNRPRGVFNSTTGVADSLSGVRYAPDALTLVGLVNLEEKVLGRSLSFTFGAQYRISWLYPASGAPIELATGPLEVESRGRRARREAGVLAGLSYAVSPEVAVTLGYVNQGDLYAPDYHLLYTPGAQFTATLGIALDAIYELATGRRRETPFFLPAARPF